MRQVRRILRIWLLLVHGWVRLPLRMVHARSAAMLRVLVRSLRWLLRLLRRLLLVLRLLRMLCRLASPPEPYSCVRLGAPAL
jgi:hypothetical protein